MSTEANQPAVVVGVDGSDTALGAARWAAEFAAVHALPLTLLHAVPNLDWHFFSAVPPPEIDQHPDRDAVLAAAETAVRSTHPDLAIRRAVVKGAIAKALADASQSHGGRSAEIHPVSLVLPGEDAARTTRRAITRDRMHQAGVR